MTVAQVTLAQVTPAQVTGAQVTGAQVTGHRGTLATDFIVKLRSTPIAQLSGRASVHYKPASYREPGLLAPSIPDFS